MTIEQFRKYVHGAIAIFMIAMGIMAGHFHGRISTLEEYIEVAAEEVTDQLGEQTHGE